MHLLNIDTDDVYDNNDQLRKYQEEVEAMDVVGMYRLNYLAAYGVPDRELSDMWAACCRARNMDALDAKYNIESKSVSAFAKSRFITTWHVVCPRFATTVTMIAAQNALSIFPNPDRLVYDRTLPDLVKLRSVAPPPTPSPRKRPTGMRC
jgi:pyoverdine/dityrosine biosynthesis protein Dit1